MEIRVKPHVVEVDSLQTQVDLEIVLEDWYQKEQRRLKIRPEMLGNS